jgi:hypothetical protein
MDPLTYLTTFSTDFGTLEWVFFIAQIAVAVAGAYLAFLRAGTHPIRGAATRRLGYALLALGGAGTLLGVLRLAGVQIFTMPIWFTVVTVAEALLIAYALYYALAIYPAQLAAYDEANRARGTRRAAARPQPAIQATGANGAPAEPRPAVSSRRDARRDRKRRAR